MGVPATTAPTTIAKTFRRVTARTKNFMPRLPKKECDPATRVVSHGAVKTTLSIKAGQPWSGAKSFEPSLWLGIG
jgi:hypothetical protein